MSETTHTTESASATVETDASELPSQAARRQMVMEWVLKDFIETELQRHIAECSDFAKAFDLPTDDEGDAQAQLAFEAEDELSFLWNHRDQEIEVWGRSRPGKILYRYGFTGDGDVRFWTSGSPTPPEVSVVHPHEIAADGSSPTI